MKKSAKIFGELLADATPRHSKRTRLTNVTLFAGAGFSKSWDENFPVGNDLFSFSYEEWSEHDGPLGELLLALNYQPHGLGLTASLFKDIVYQIGMMRKYPVIRPRYIDENNLDMVERHLRYLVRKKFESVAPLYYRGSGPRLALPKKLTRQQRSIVKFFRALSASRDGSSVVAEGIRPNFITTNYDFVIEAILDANLGIDDTFSLYTYRGITPSLYCGDRPDRVVLENGLVSNLLKINGGFEVFSRNGGFEIDYRDSRSDKELQDNPPQIMLASREQDYTQSYFHAMFPKVIRLLHDTSVLVVVGYSLPEEDALLRLIIRQFAEDRADGVRKLLFYVDMCDEKKQTKRVNDLFPHAGELHGLAVIPYCGSFAQWCAAVNKSYADAVARLT